MAQALGIGEIDKSTVEEIQKLVDKIKRSKVRVLVTGKVGAGKSTLLNYVFGKEFEEPFKEGDGLQPCTMKVTKKCATINGVTFELFDSPGLQDGTGNEASYIKDMQDTCQELDLVIFCISMIAARADLDQEASALSKITKALGTEIWKNAIICLTYGNIVEKRLIKSNPERNIEVVFKETVSNWSSEMVGALKMQGIDKQVIGRVQDHVCVAGFKKKKSLPGVDDWITDVWLHCFQSMSESAQPQVLVMAIDKFIDEKDPEVEAYKKREITPEERKLILTPNVKAALGLTSAAGTAVITGATIGAVIGMFAIGLPTFGVGAGAGLVIGGAVGTSVALGVAALGGFIVKRRKKHLLSKLK